MEPIEILNKAIEARSLFMAAAGKYGDPIRLCDGGVDLVNVYRGIEQLAEAAGANLVREKVASEDYPFQDSFFYQGVRFIRLVPRDDDNG